MNLLEFDIQDYFDDSDSFSTADGLSIAFASTRELDPAYASLELYSPNGVLTQTLARNSLSLSYKAYTLALLPN